MNVGDKEIDDYNEQKFEETKKSYVYNEDNFEETQIINHLEKQAHKRNDF